MESESFLWTIDALKTDEWRERKAWRDVERDELKMCSLYFSEPYKSQEPINDILERNFEKMDSEQINSIVKKFLTLEKNGSFEYYHNAANFLILLLKDEDFDFDNGETISPYFNVLRILRELKLNESQISVLLSLITLDIFGDFCNDWVIDCLFLVFQAPQNLFTSIEPIFSLIEDHTRTPFINAGVAPYGTAIYSGIYINFIRDITQTEISDKDKQEEERRKLEQSQAKERIRICMEKLLDGIACTDREYTDDLKMLIIEYFKDRVSETSTVSHLLPKIRPLFNDVTDRDNIGYYDSLCLFLEEDLGKHDVVDPYTKKNYIRKCHCCDGIRVLCKRKNREKNQIEYKKFVELSRTTYEKGNFKECITNLNNVISHRMTQKKKENGDTGDLEFLKMRILSYKSIKEKYSSLLDFFFFTKGSQNMQYRSSKFNRLEKIPEIESSDGYSIRIISRNLERENRKRCFKLQQEIRKIRKTEKNQKKSKDKKITSFQFQIRRKLKIRNEYKLKSSYEINRLYNLELPSFFDENESELFFYCQDNHTILAICPKSNKTFYSIDKNDLQFSGVDRIDNILVKKHLLLVTSKLKFRLFSWKKHHQKKKKRKPPSLIFQKTIGNLIFGCKNTLAMDIDIKKKIDDNSTINELYYLVFQQKCFIFRIILGKTDDQEIIVEFPSKIITGYQFYSCLKCYNGSVFVDTEFAALEYDLETCDLRTIYFYKKVIPTMEERKNSYNERRERKRVKFIFRNSILESTKFFIVILEFTYQYRDFIDFLVFEKRSTTKEEEEESESSSSSTKVVQGKYAILIPDLKSSKKVSKKIGLVMENERDRFIFFSSRETRIYIIDLRYLRLIHVDYPKSIRFVDYIVKDLGIFVEEEEKNNDFVFMLLSSKRKIHYFNITYNINGIVKKRKKIRECDGCNRIGFGYKRCSCKNHFYYCSLNCQKKDWKYHKKYCN